jgi:hypothetical protein
MVEPIYMYLGKPNYLLDETHLFRTKGVFIGLKPYFKKRNR